MFIQATDFTDVPYKIPNQEESRGFVAFIEAEETKILKELFGLQLYNDFKEGLETSGDVEQRWTDLQDGAEYEYSGKLYEYLGIVDFLKPEIYSRWLSQSNGAWRKLTSSGVIVNTGQEDTTSVNPDIEIVNSHNEYVKKVGGIFKQENSLYGFLVANDPDYEEVEFCEPRIENTFNL